MLLLAFLALVAIVLILQSSESNECFVQPRVVNYQQAPAPYVPRPQPVLPPNQIYIRQAPVAAPEPKIPESGGLFGFSNRLLGAAVILGTVNSINNANLIRRQQQQFYQRQNLLNQYYSNSDLNNQNMIFTNSQDLGAMCSSSTLEQCKSGCCYQGQCAPYEICFGTTITTV